MKREVWYKVTVWFDILYLGPYYIFAIYAIIKGKEWIRIPSLIFCGITLVSVSCIMGEQIFGNNAAPNIFITSLAYGPWILFPFILLLRMIPEHPFTK